MSFLLKRSKNALKWLVNLKFRMRARLLVRQVKHSSLKPQISGHNIYLICFNFLGIMVIASPIMLALGHQHIHTHNFENLLYMLRPDALKSALNSGTYLCTCMKC